MPKRGVPQLLSRSLLLAAGLSTVLVAGGCGRHHHRGGYAAAAAPGAPVRGVTVSGLGKVSSQPDIARSIIGVEARAGTAEQAMVEVNARMAQVIAAVKQVGVADKDVRTETVSLSFERNYEPPPRPVELAPVAAPAGKATPAGSKPEAVEAPAPKLPQGFYTATNNVEVTIRNLEQAGKVLSAATSAGANQLYGIRFEIEDPAPLRAEARKKAVEDARARAERLAQLAGVRLGAPVSITELDAGSPGPMPAFAALRNEAAAVPVERGELTVSSSVQIVYSLAD